MVIKMDNFIEVFCVNIRRLSNTTKLNQICDIIKSLKKTSSYCLLIQGTKFTRLKIEHEKVLKHYKTKYELVPAIMMSGGLLTLTPETLKDQVCLKTPSCLAIEIKTGEKSKQL